MSSGGKYPDQPDAGTAGYKFYEYHLEGGWQVYAGRTDEDNDYLSTKFARPNDWWFHVRGMPGSHVVLRAKEGEDPDREVLRQAAAIAAFHSKAKTGGTIAVSYTQAKYVTKPRGVKLGTVHIKREKVIKVKPGVPEKNEQ